MVNFRGTPLFHFSPARPGGGRRGEYGGAGLLSPFTRLAGDEIYSGSRPRLHISPTKIQALDKLNCRERSGAPDRAREAEGAYPLT
jgi:hypothetical protein